jgi:hypothetical protein
MPHGRGGKHKRNRLILAGLATVALIAVAWVVVALWNAPRLRNGGPDEIPTASPFMGNYVPVTRAHGPNQAPFPGGHNEYLQGRVYETIAAALTDPRLREEDNCRILLLDEVYQEQEEINATALPHGISIQSARTDPPTLWLPPERADPTNPLLRITGGSRLVVRNLTFNGLGRFDTPVVWHEPGPGCQFHDIRVTRFAKSGVSLHNPAGEAHDPVQLSHIRIYPDSTSPVETCVAVTAPAGKSARHLRLTECRLEGPAAQGLVSADGIESFEMSRCRLFSLGSGVRFDGPGALRATLKSNTFAKVPNPVWIGTLPPSPEKDDELVLASNLFFEATSAVRYTNATPVAKLFRGSDANWSWNSVGGGLPSTPGVPIQTAADLIIRLEPTKTEKDGAVKEDEDFLRYSDKSPLATAGPGGQPIGVPPRGN